MKQTLVDKKIVRMIVLMLLEKTKEIGSLKQYTTKQIGESLGLDGTDNYIRTMTSRYMAQLPEIRQEVESVYRDAQAYLMGMPNAPMIEANLEVTK